MSTSPVYLVVYCSVSAPPEEHKKIEKYWEMSSRILRCAWLQWMQFMRHSTEFLKFLTHFPREGGLHAALHCCDGWVGVPPERPVTSTPEFGPSRQRAKTDSCAVKEGPHHNHHNRKVTTARKGAAIALVVATRAAYGSCDASPRAAERRPTGTDDRHPSQGG